MKLARLPILLLPASLLIACGSQPAKTINGAWQASLLNSSRSAAYVFSSEMSQGTSSAVAISSFNFNSPAPCFAGSLGQTATFSVTGASNGYQTGPFQMTITTLFPQQSNNVLQLTGNRSGSGGIAGNWSITGLTGCPASGTFTMSPPIPVDPPIH